MGMCRSTLTSRRPAARSIVGFGADKDNDAGGTSRFFAVFDGSIHFWSSNRDVETEIAAGSGRWQMLTATYDGKTLTLYKDGDPIGKKDIELSDDSESSVSVGTTDPWDHAAQLRFEPSAELHHSPHGADG